MGALNNKSQAGDQAPKGEEKGQPPARPTLALTSFQACRRECHTGCLALLSNLCGTSPGSQAGSGGPMCKEKPCVQHLICQLMSLATPEAKLGILFADTEGGWLAEIGQLCFLHSFEH